MNREQFKQKFQLPWNGFGEPIDLQDTDIGFSVFKIRENPDFLSLFRVFIKNEISRSDQLSKPVIVTASYGKKAENGITISSSDFKRKLNWPVEIISENEFYYDTVTNQFSYKGKTITGRELLEIVDNLHTKSARPIDGFWLRFKQWWFHIVVASFILFCFQIIVWIKYLLSGQKQKINIFLSILDPERYTSINIDRPLEAPQKSKPIKVFEYEVEPWIAVMYSLFHLMVFSVMYFYSKRPLWLITIFKNNFLTLVYGIVSLALMNVFLQEVAKSVGPNLLNIPLKYLQSRYFEYSSKRIKIEDNFLLIVTILLLILIIGFVYKAPLLNWYSILLFRIEWFNFCFFK